MMLGVNALSGGGAIMAAGSVLDLSPALWLDASDSSTITAPGNAVEQWRDKSGNARHFSQSVAGSKPTTNTLTQNGLNVIDFAADFLDSDSTASVWNFLHDGTPHSIFAVVKFGNVADPNALYALLGNNTGSTNGKRGSSLFFDDRASVPRNNTIVHLIGNGGTTVGTREVVVYPNSIAGVMTANAYHLLEVVADPSNATAASRSTVYSDNGSGVQNNTHTNAPSASDASHVLQLGAPGTGGFPLTGQIGELIIIPGIISAGDRTDLIFDLDTKWNTPA